MSAQIERLVNFGAVGASGLVFVFSIVGLATPMLTMSTPFYSLTVTLWSVTSTVNFSLFGVTISQSITQSASEVKGGSCSIGEKMQAGEAFGIFLLMTALGLGAVYALRVAPQFIPTAPRLESFHPLLCYAGIALASWATFCSMIVFAMFSGLKSCSTDPSGTSPSYGGGWVMYLLSFLACMGLVAMEAYSLFVLKKALPNQPELPLAQPMMAMHPPPPQSQNQVQQVYHQQPPVAAVSSNDHEDL